MEATAEMIAAAAPFQCIKTPRCPEPCVGCRDGAKVALEKALAVMPKHKIELDGPPCPMCGTALRWKPGEPSRIDGVVLHER